MPKFLRILFLISFFSLIVTTVSNSFTISAEVSRIAIVNLEPSFISAYISDIEIYLKFFPNMVSVTSLNDKESEWIYRIEAPLSSPYNISFIQVNKSPSPDTIIFESKEKSNDYLYCNAILNKISEEKTKINFLFKISMTRSKASDIHILAGILGEKFLSEKMKEKLESDLEDFISQTTKDMHITSRTSGKD